jgi:hypothetical protein
MRASLLAAGVLALMGGACGSASSRSPSRPVPPNQTGTTTSQTNAGAGQDSFRGGVTSASGAYAGEGGRAEVLLHTRGAGSSRPVTLTFRSLPCQGAPQCVQLDGTLNGRIVTRPGGVPDTGRSSSVTATGRLTTLGSVTAAGIVHGTGFISQGHELLELTLRNRSGRITLRVLTGPVRGFSSP